MHKATSQFLDCTRRGVGAHKGLEFKRALGAMSLEMLFREKASIQDSLEDSIPAEDLSLHVSQASKKSFYRRVRTRHAIAKRLVDREIIHKSMK